MLIAQQSIQLLVTLQGPCLMTGARCYIFPCCSQGECSQCPIPACMRIVLWAGASLGVFAACKRPRQSECMCPDMQTHPRALPAAARRSVLKLVSVLQGVQQCPRA